MQSFKEQQEEIRKPSSAIKDSCQCMAKPIKVLKNKKILKNLKRKKNRGKQQNG